MKKRIGGASRLQREVDKDTAAWLADTVQNPSTVTTKQRADQARVRANLDVHPDVKRALERIAFQQQTGLAQAGGFLLAWAVREYFRGNALAAEMSAAREYNPSPRAEYKLVLPDEWIDTLTEK